MKISNELKIGFLVILTLLFFILGYAFIKNKSIFSTNQIYYVFCDNVDGINISDPVTIRGIKIGIIKEFILASSGVKLTIETNGKIKIPVNSTVNIDGGNLFGKRRVSLILGNSLQEASQGTVFSTLESKSILSNVNYLKDNLVVTLNKLNKVLDSASEVFSDVNKSRLQSSIANLSNTFNNLKKFSATLNKQGENISEVVSEAKQFTKSLNKTFPKLDNTITNFEALSYQLSKVDIKTSLTNTQKTLDKINASFAAHNNIMSAIFNDDKLYNNLIQTTADLDRLLVDIRTNPQAFFHFSVFGKKVNLKPSVYNVKDAPTSKPAN